MAETAYYSALTCINAPKDQGYLDFISNICIFDMACGRCKDRAQGLPATQEQENATVVQPYQHAFPARPSLKNFRTPFHPHPLPPERT